MSRREIKTLAKVEFKEHWGLLLMVLILSSIAEGIASIIGFGIGALVVSGPLLVGTYYVTFRVIRKEETDWKDMFIGFKTMFVDSFAVGMLTILYIFIPLIIVAAVGVVIGSALTVLIPFIGIFSTVLIYVVIIIMAIVLSYVYAEAPIILLKEPGIKPIDALKKSKAMTQGVKKELFIFDLSYIGWFVLGFISFGILFIYVAPYYCYAKTMLLGQIYDERCGISVDDDEDLKRLMAMKDNIQGVKNTEPASTFEARETEQIDLNACKYCGAKLPEGALFCGKCGKQQ